MAMKEKQAQRVLPRGRVAQWTREQIAKLATPELRQLFANAQRLNETELATTCNELLTARPHGHPRPARSSANRQRRLVSWRQAFELHGVSLRSKSWSRGGIRGDGAVMMGIPAENLRSAEGEDTYLLWAPNDEADQHPWSDTPGGQERLEHCRIALERGAAEGLLTYSKAVSITGATVVDGGLSAVKVDAGTVLSLRVEKRGEEYWATAHGKNRLVHDVK